jgi:membrane protein required for colicin V production
MNWIDGVILGILGISVAFGIFRGALSTVFSFAGLVVGFFVATRESGALAMVLGRFLPENVAFLVSFALLLLAIALLFAVVAHFVRVVLKKLSLGWVDALFGGAVGLVRAAALLGVAALIAEGVGPPKAARESVTYPYAVVAGKLILKAVPPNELGILEDLLRKSPELAEGVT